MSVKRSNPDRNAQRSSPDAQPALSVKRSGPDRNAPALTLDAQSAQKAQLWPIVKRLPAYLRCGWALIREPAIPLKHKALLYSVVLYSVTPANLIVGAIPVVGQVDNTLLFLLGLRQAFANCPPEIAARHLKRAGLDAGQLDQDLATIMTLARRALRRGRREIRFAGRVAGGMSRRIARRLIARRPPPAKPEPGPG